MAHLRKSSYYMFLVPTTKPRYTVTDTADVARALDVAARRWPEHAGNRRRLLDLLIAEGQERISEDVSGGANRRLLVDELPGLVDAGVLLSDAAWR